MALNPLGTDNVWFYIFHKVNNSLFHEVNNFQSHMNHLSLYKQRENHSDREKTVMNLLYFLHEEQREKDQSICHKLAM
jgi:hypothetical protein